MEDSLVQLNEVEHIFLYKIFEEQCPFFMSIGMTYEQFWRDDPTIAKMYLKTYKINREKEQIKIWKQGMYTYEALCDVSPVLHAFSKSGTKPLPYPSTPYGMEEYKQKIENEKEPTEQEVENERLKAQIFFNNWAKATTKHFNNER